MVFVPTKLRRTCFVRHDVITHLERPTSHELNVRANSTEDQSRNLPITERARLSCNLAKQFEKAGEYETACEAISEFWPERSQRPNLDRLDESTKADVLLRVGGLAGWLGGANQTEGSQEVAKDLISQSLQIFEKFGHVEKIAEARGDLALCYWREGAFEEARIQVKFALDLLPAGHDELRAVLLIRAGIIEERAQQLQKALDFYYKAAPLLEHTDDHALKGAFHNEFALLFTRLGTEENRGDYLDRALIEAAAASFHFEEAGNTRYLARVENNLGFLYFTIGRYQDAHYHLDRARDLFLQLKDVGTAAQVDETRARTLLAEGSLKNAERTIKAAVESSRRVGNRRFWLRRSPPRELSRPAWATRRALGYCYNARSLSRKQSAIARVQVART